MNGRYKRKSPWLLLSASGSFWRGYSFWQGATQSYIYSVADGSAMYEAC